jgi:hypothetical protein
METFQHNLNADMFFQILLNLLSEEVFSLLMTNRACWRKLNESDFGGTLFELQPDSRYRMIFLKSLKMSNEVGRNKESLRLSS